MADDDLCDVDLWLDDEWVDDFFAESDEAIGAEEPAAGLVWAKAPKLTAEAMTAMMRVFMEGPCVVGWEPIARADNAGLPKAVDTFAARGSLEPALAHPLRRDPLLARADLGAAVQRSRRRVRPVVAEEDGIALHRRDLEAGVGEDGRAARLGRVEVADDRGRRAGRRARGSFGVPGSAGSK